MNKFLKYATAIALVLAVSTPALAQTSTPKFEIITPSEGQTVYGSKIPVLFNVNVENFQLVDYQQNTKPAAGQGHIHVWLDDANPTAQTAIKISQDTYTFPDVAFGEHTLQAELVTNDHKSLKPPQVVSVKFKNEAIPQSEQSQTTGFDKKTAAVILVVVALVIVAAWWYTKDEDEEEMEKPARKIKKTSRRKKI